MLRSFIRRLTQLGKALATGPPLRLGWLGQYPCWRGLGALSAAAYLAGCHPQQPQQATPPVAAPPAVASQPAAAVASPPVVEAEPPAEVAPEAPPCPPTPLRFKPLRTGPVFRHYAGTIGKERASAELSWTHPDSVTGYCYRWRGGLEYQLKATRRHRGPLVLALSQEVADLGQPRGTWRLAAPLGPVLRGTWVDAAGRRQPFSLRESYRQAVPYTIQELTLTGGRPTADFCSPSLTQSYLHLLGRLRPAWQRVQALPLAVRKRRLLATYGQEGDTSYFVWVCLNDFNLLSCQTFYTAFMEGGPGRMGWRVPCLTWRPAAPSRWPASCNPATSRRCAACWPSSSYAT